MDAFAPSASRQVASWRNRPVLELERGQNALTVDVEDYFQVEALAPRIRREDWNSRECRIEANLDRILQLCRDSGARGTFFTLGWIAQRYKGMIRRIVAEGHELASHGYDHLRADRIGREEFLRDIREAKTLLEDVAGQPVLGYRAPCFSIGAGNLWALRAVQEAGYRYSSSIYPIRHDAYGLPGAPRFAFRPYAEEQFIEIPVSSIRLVGSNWPCGGGGYFRLLPMAWSMAALGHIARREGRACVFYFHPWEIDPGQPPVPHLPFKSRLRHYTNLGRMERRLQALLRRFSWNRMDRIFPVAPGDAHA